MVERKNRKSEKSGKSSGSLNLYLNEISKIQVLSKEEEAETAKLAVAGDKAATEKLVKSNLRFVIMIAKKYQGRGFPLQDLISEGNIGLLNAVKNYDADKGYRFITYAVWWIRQSILKALSDKGRMIRLPVTKTSDLARIERGRQVVRGKSCGKPVMELEETAAFLEMPAEKVTRLVKMGQDVISLDAPVSPRDNASTTVKDHIEDDCHDSPVDYAIKSSLKDDLEAALSSLEERAGEVLRCRFGLDGCGSMTLKEVGDRYFLSRERVRQIEQRAIIQLQESPRVARLGSYIAG